MVSKNCDFWCELLPLSTPCSCSWCSWYSPFGFVILTTASPAWAPATGFHCTQLMCTSWPCTYGEEGLEGLLALTLLLGWEFAGRLLLLLFESSAVAWEVPEECPNVGGNAPASSWGPGTGRSSDFSCESSSLSPLHAVSYDESVAPSVWKKN